MDLKTLKLELLERIALLEDEARLLALKRLLDSPRGYGIPNDHLSVVKEGEEPYLNLEDRSYTVEDVRQLVDKLMKAKESNEDFIGSFIPDERPAIDPEDEEADRGEGSFHTIAEVLERLRKDLEK